MARADPSSTAVLGEHGLSLFAPGRSPMHLPAPQTTSLLLQGAEIGQIITAV